MNECRVPDEDVGAAVREKESLVSGDVIQATGKKVQLDVGTQDVGMCLRDDGMGHTTSSSATCGHTMCHITVFPATHFNERQVLLFL